MHDALPWREVGAAESSRHGRGRGRADANFEPRWARELGNGLCRRRLGTAVPPLEAAHRALTGRLPVASAERHDGDGFALRPCRRYSHAANYLIDCAARSGLEVVEIEASTLRTELGMPCGGGRTP